MDTTYYITEEYGVSYVMVKDEDVILRDNKF